MKDTQRQTPPEESRNHKIMMVVALAFAAFAFVSEFLFVKTPSNHGMWIVFGIAGLGIAGVFYLILKIEKEQAGNKSASAS